MKTTLLTPETDENAIKTAAELIRQGEVVGMPTETVYGLAANALNGEAVKKIFLAKGRPQDNPLIVHIADFDQIYDLCPSVPPQAKQLAEAFWPGPMTMIVPKGDCIPDEVSCGLDTVGIRLPSHPMARALIRESGVPLAAPSANTSGRPSTTTAARAASAWRARSSRSRSSGRACCVRAASRSNSCARCSARSMWTAHCTRRSETT